jgi:parallel beta-helix repeat protein
LGSHSSFNQVSNNTLIASDQNHSFGISVWGSFNNISQNTVTGFYKGVEVFSGDHNTVTYNTLSDTLPVKLWDNATNSDVRNNTLIEAATPSISPSITPTVLELQIIGTVSLLAVASISLVYIKKHKPKTELNEKS